MVEFLLLAVGLALIFLAGRYLVEGASDLALGLGISPFIVGITIIGFGTSAPEFFLGALSSLEGEGQLSVGNVIGANINNITFIIGVFAVITPVLVQFSEVRKQGLAALLALSAFILLGLDGTLAWLDGIIMLIIFAGILTWTLYGLHTCRPSEAVCQEFKELGNPRRTVKRDLLIIILTLAILAIGSQITLDAAVAISLDLGLSEVLIGATIVSFGTTLPELTISIISARRRQADIAIGNLFGTLCFNTLVVLGTASLFSDLDFGGTLPMLALPIIIGLTALLMVIAYVKVPLGRKIGISLILLYLLFLTASVVLD